MKKWLVLVLAVSSVLLAACGGTATPETITREVPVEVTRIVEGTPVVETILEEVIITATPPPMEEVEKILVICMSQEPTTLIWSESALVTNAVLQAVQEPAYDQREYGYQPVLVEKLPSFEDGDASLVEVTVGEGDRVYDVATDNYLTLTAGMTESFTLSQLEGEPLVIEQWDGSDLTTVQSTAQWTFVDGLTWEDGTPVTADDSVFAFEIALDPNWPGVDKNVAERSASYTALDDRTIEWVGMPGYTSSTYFLNVWAPIPRHAYGDLSVTEMQESELVNRDPLGYGPYQIDEWIAGESITLSPNPHYFRGEVPLDSLIYRFVPDTNQLVAQLASGECDVGTQDSAFESSLPLIRSFEEQGLMKVLDVAGTSFEHLDFNLLPVEGYAGAAVTLLDNEGNPLFRNVEFRRAIAHCLDKQAIVDQSTNGAGYVQEVYSAPDHPLYPGDDAITIYEFDPARGLELLAGLGWTDSDGDGVLNDADGNPLTFIHSTRQNPLRELVTQIVQSQLIENCQIQTQIELIGSEYFSDGPDGLVFGRKFDMAEFAWNTGVQPPCNLYVTTAIPNEVNGWGQSNNTGYSNADFDNACNAALVALDDEEEARLHGEAMALFTEELPSIALFARSKLAVVRPGVENVFVDPTENSELWNVENFDIVQ